MLVATCRYVTVLQYVANLGMDVSKFQFHDVFGLDPDLLAMVPQPCIAFLLLFPINEKVVLSQEHNNLL